MNQTWITLSMLFFLVIRIAVPILITFFLSWALRKLDARWREEAESLRYTAQPATEKITPACWIVNGCSENVKNECKAFNNPLVPCWDLFKATTGNLSAKCKKCPYRKQVYHAETMLTATL